MVMEVYVFFLILLETLTFILETLGDARSATEPSGLSSRKKKAGL
jgi:hypothetical protein